LAISLVDFRPLPLLPLSSLLTTPNISNNHGSNDKLCQLLQKRFPTWITVHHRIRCISYVINLNVQAFLFTKNQETMELAVQAAEELQAAEQCVQQPAPSELLGSERELGPPIDRSLFTAPK